jgi:two-component system nitrogen regulation response regulator NtrX
MARILVIDDESAVLSALAGLLRRKGHEVFEASDGATGLELLQKQGVDLVIIDIYMPGLGGLATIPLLRRNWPTLKIIAISGAAHPQEAGARATALGADHFQSKPFEPSELLFVVRSLLPEQQAPSA